MAREVVVEVPVDLEQAVPHGLDPFRPATDLLAALHLGAVEDLDGPIADPAQVGEVGGQRTHRRVQRAHAGGPGRPPRAQHGQRLLVLPGRVTELHGIAHLGGQRLEEAVQRAQAIGQEARRELQQQRAPLLAQQAHALDEGVRQIQPLQSPRLVRQLAGELGAEDEALRRTAGPVLHHLRAGHGVEGGVDLHRAEDATVVAQVVRGLGAGWVEDAVPVLVAPAAGAHQHPRATGPPGAEGRQGRLFVHEGLLAPVAAFLFHGNMIAARITRRQDPRVPFGIARRTRRP